MRAYVLIEATIGKARDVATKLKTMPGVKECYLVTGPYDIVAIVEGKDANTVGKTVAEKVHNVPGIARTVTCLALGI